VGADSKLGEALKDIPFWAFPADAGRMWSRSWRRPYLSRRSPRAGGLPRYRERRGLEHNIGDRPNAEADMGWPHSLFPIS
jgi:hypothetical protein